MDELDLKLAEFLNFKGGIFIEAGANDGLSYSNTAYLEKFRNWTGLLIEPIPQLAQQCALNRPNSIVESCALVPFALADPMVDMWYCHLMSLVKGARGSEEADMAHIAKGMEVQAGVTPYQLRVPASPLSEVLDRHRIDRIDFFSLDVEGYEASVLKGVNFSRHRPTYVLVETSDLASIDQILLPHYTRVAMLSHHDYLYRNRDI